MDLGLNMRQLKPQDFGKLWELGLPHVDVYDHLTPDRNMAKQAYIKNLSSKRNFMVGMFHGKQLVGAICVISRPNPFHRKDHAQVVAWLGPVALLQAAIDWFDTRPGCRMLGLQFDRPVRPGMQRRLRMLGFERSGDVYYYWG